MFPFKLLVDSLGRSSPWQTSWRTFVHRIPSFHQEDVPTKLQHFDPSHISQQDLLPLRVDTVCIRDTTGHVLQVRVTHCNAFQYLVEWLTIPTRPMTIQDPVPAHPFRPTIAEL
ncbi:hypothetical protein SprV_0100221300 [Sparganum proliferum]